MNSLRNNQQYTSLEEHEKIKQHPTCEKSSETSFSIDKEIIKKFVDHMVRVWKDLKNMKIEKIHH